MSYTQEEIIEGVDKTKKQFVEQLKKYGVDSYIINLELPAVSGDAPDNCHGSAPAIHCNGKHLVALLADLMCSALEDLDEKDRIAIVGLIAVTTIKTLEVQDKYGGRDYHFDQQKLYEIMKAKLAEHDGKD